MVKQVTMWKDKYGKFHESEREAKSAECLSTLNILFDEMYGKDVESRGTISVYLAEASKDRVHVEALIEYLKDNHCRHMSFKNEREYTW